MQKRDLIDRISSLYESYEKCIKNDIEFKGNNYKNILKELEPFSSPNHKNIFDILLVDNPIVVYNLVCLHPKGYYYNLYGGYYPYADGPLIHIKNMKNVSLQKRTRSSNNTTVSRLTSVNESNVYIFQTIIYDNANTPGKLIRKSNTENTKDSNSDSSELNTISCGNCSEYVTSELS